MSHCQGLARVYVLGLRFDCGLKQSESILENMIAKPLNVALQDKYHVTFFGIQATRAWIGKKFIKVYNPDDKEDQLKYVSFSGYKCVFIVFIVF